MRKSVKLISSLAAAVCATVYIAGMAMAAGETGIFKFARPTEPEEGLGVFTAPQDRILKFTGNVSTPGYWDWPHTFAVGYENYALYSMCLENTPELYSVIDGLDPEKLYKVYVHFIAPPDVPNWGIYAYVNDPSYTKEPFTPLNSRLVSVDPSGSINNYEHFVGITGGHGRTWERIYIKDLQDLVSTYGGARTVYRGISYEEAINNLTVNATLENFGGNLSLVNIQCDVVNGTGGVVDTATITPQSTSVAFDFYNVPAGNYTVKVSGPKWLSRSMEMDVTSTGHVTANLSLPNGDLDGSCEVDWDDYNYVVNSFGMLGD